ncbi:MAG: hypothetical protein IPK85_03425 [Gemmatimonadetes bacterium]|nr:hypothetical protein [Gemmatimonadota bacterium]
MSDCLDRTVILLLESDPLGWEINANSARHEATGTSVINSYMHGWEINNLDDSVRWWWRGRLKRALHNAANAKLLAAVGGAK